METKVQSLFETKGNQSDGVQKGINKIQTLMENFVPAGVVITTGHKCTVVMTKLAGNVFRGLCYATGDYHEGRRNASRLGAGAHPRNSAGYKFCQI